jgi:hypothetical protein
MFQALGTFYQCMRHITGLIDRLIGKLDQLYIASHLLYTKV